MSQQPIVASRDLDSEVGDHPDKIQTLRALESFPTWMIQKDAVKIVQALISKDPFEPRPVSYQIRDLKYMGPAVGWAALQNAVTWVAFLLCPLVLRTASQLQWFLFSAIYMSTSLTLKIQTSRYTLPCFVHICVPSIIRRPFLYAFFMLGLSAMNSADVLVNTVFVTELSKSTSLAWILWCFMLLQPMYVIGMAMPIGLVENYVTKQMFPWHYDIPDVEAQTAVHKTFLEQTQTHQGTLLALAHGGRMQCVIFHAQMYLSKFHATRQTCAPATKALKQQLYRCVVFTILESVLFLTVKGQVAIASCRDGTCNRVAIFGAIIGSVTGLHALYQDSVSMWSFYCDALLGNWHFWTELDDEQRRHKGLDSEWQSLNEASFYLVLQVIASGACMLALVQLPLQVLWIGFQYG